MGGGEGGGAGMHRGTVERKGQPLALLHPVIERKKEGPTWRGKEGGRKKERSDGRRQ